MDKTLKQQWEEYAESCAPGMEPDDYEEWLEKKVMALQSGLQVGKKDKARIGQRHEYEDLIHCASVHSAELGGNLICSDWNAVQDTLVSIYDDNGAGFEGDFDDTITITFTSMTREQLENLPEFAGW